MVRWGMVIDLDKCVACQACTIACKSENNQPFSAKSDPESRRFAWTDVISMIEGRYPNVRVTMIPRPCMHCENPPCVKVCPVGATYMNEEGIVMQDYDRCIGCRYCMVACPYAARYFNWEEPKWPEPMTQYLNPDKASLRPPGRQGPEVRPVGVVEKCTFCIHRIEKLTAIAKEQNRLLKDEEVKFLTACNEACPSRARFFGDLDNPNSTVSKLASSPRAFRLKEDLGTRPKVIYLAQG